MENQKHTPGEWEANTESDASLSRILEVIRSGDKVVALTGHPDFDTLPEEERKANARLIASAPELLEAAREALKNIGEIINGDAPSRTLWKTRHLELTNAISKAEGR